LNIQLEVRRQAEKKRNRVTRPKKGRPEQQPDKGGLLLLRGNETLREEVKMTQKAKRGLHQKSPAYTLTSKSIKKKRILELECERRPCLTIRKKKDERVGMKVEKGRNKQRHVRYKLNEKTD